MRTTFIIQFIAILFVLMGNYSNLSAESLIKKRIAILDFNAENTSGTYANAVRNLFEVALHKSESVDILERNQMETILKEQGFQLSGCTESSCAVEIGKLLSADFVLMGSLNKLGIYTIVIKLVNVNDGKIKLADEESTDKEEELKGRIEKLVQRLALEFNRDKIANPESTEIIDKKKEEIKEEKKDGKKEESPAPSVTTTSYDTSINGYFISPTGRFKKLTENGYGSGISFYAKNYLFNNSVLGTDLSYWIFSPSKKGVESCYMFPLHLFVGYNITFYRNFNFIPVLGAGLTYNSIKYDSTVLKGSDGSSIEYTGKLGFLISYQYHNINMKAGIFYGSLFEKSNRLDYYILNIGIGKVF